MSQQQRDTVDRMLRDHPASPGATVDQQRAGFRALMSTMRVPADIRVSETELAGLRTLRIEPAGTARPGTILYFHGGAHVFGSPETAISVTAALVSRTGIPALSVDYRLAPEHPFPADVDDALAAYRALIDEGRDPLGIAIAGDSAGGGLAIATLVGARDSGLPMPAAVATFSAGLDRTRSGESMRTKVALDPIFTPEALAANNARYLPDADLRQPLASPAVSADPTGFPPLLLQVGSNELMLDDSRTLAARAVDAGVDVVLDVTAGVPHVFQSFSGVLDEADRALDRAALFLRQHVSEAPTR